MNKKKPLRILLIDDEREYFEKLKRAHPEYHFDYCDSIDNVCKELENRRSQDKWPDILLLDVYWPKNDHLSSSVKAARNKTKQILENEVHPAIDKLNKAYLSEFDKWGTRELIKIRRRYTSKQLPIVMYSSKGHYLLRDAAQDWLSETLEHNASWLCKGTSCLR